MANEIRESTLAVKEPNTGWPDVTATMQVQWEIDFSEAYTTQDTIVYTSIEIFREVDNTQQSWTVSGSSTWDSSTRIMTTEVVTVPADPDESEHYAKVWYTKDGLIQCELIPFRVI